MYIQNLPSSESKVGPPIIKESPPLANTKRIIEVGRMEISEPKPRRILTQKRALQAVTALAITVGVLLLIVIVLLVVMLRTNTRGTYININYHTMHVSYCTHINIY